MRYFIFAIFLLVIGLFVGNTSLFSHFPAGDGPRLIAHRGQHQLFDRTGLDGESCTASRIYKPEHPLLENTLPSMQAAFASGADVVELDVHLTPDGEFAVFHDWTLDCRTNGSGITEETPMSLLKTLDIGYGYTFDGGRTFPFRGTGIGLMPTLDEVLTTLPQGRFLINFKSRRTEEGAELARLLGDPALRERIFGVYGGEEPTNEAVASVAGLKGYGKSSAKSCLLGYLATGWSGYVPEACRNALVPVPVNYAPFLWGWPERFYNRMAAAGSEVLLLGPIAAGDPGSSGIDDIAQWKSVPAGFAGYVWTNRIEKTAALARESGYCDRSPASRLCNR
ncbi:glycerophosphodiester phosphodiesterase family protein [Rhizobium cremeum]|uniref:glycerophosphodiester phosphodiesterase family protein n=1 Tax=Rhizobium cremeum TaxID=2813827 RepID=UPI000DE09E37